MDNVPRSQNIMNFSSKTNRKEEKELKIL